MFLNLTPHEIVVVDAQGVHHRFPSSGVARVSAAPGGKGLLDGFTVQDADQFGAPTGVPAPQDGVHLIVSAIVGAALRGRPDVLVPGTGPSDGAIRDDQGRITAVTVLKHV